jgi:hypothetical protein
MSEAWVGDWFQRVKHRARERGYDTVTAFADAQPTATLLELANQLGVEDVAPAQLEKVLLHEADESGKLEHCARSLFVRSLWHRLPEGWHAEWSEEELGPAYRRASAFVLWATALNSRFDQVTDTVWKTLLALPIPPGWLPDGPDDPYIIQAFQHWRNPD